MEFQDIMQVLSHFSDLGAEFLVDEMIANSREIDLLSEDIESRTQVLDNLLEELNEQRKALENAMLGLEALDVEIIRTNTECKRVTKNVVKLKSLNVSKTTVEPTNNDREKLATNRLRLSLMKQMLETTIVDTDKLLIMSSDPPKMKTLVLKDNNSNQKNRELIWKTLGNFSGLNEEWRRLFKMD